MVPTYSSGCGECLQVLLPCPSHALATRGAGSSAGSTLPNFCHWLAATRTRPRLAAIIQSLLILNYATTPGLWCAAADCCG